MVNLKCKRYSKWVSLYSQSIKIKSNPNKYSNETMNTSQKQIDEKVIETVPFLENFPFDEFSISLAELPPPTGVISNNPIKIINFECLNGINSTINIFEKELWFLNSISDKITQLNDIKVSIDNGLAAPTILAKRDAILACEKWTTSFDETGQMKFSHETFLSVLAAMIDNHHTENPKPLVDSINKLHQKTGIVRLDRQSEKTILCYYQFQLIYFKMVLGIIIASKISV